MEVKLWRKLSYDFDKTYKIKPYLSGAMKWAIMYKPYDTEYVYRSYFFYKKQEAEEAYKYLKYIWMQEQIKKRRKKK